MTPGFDQSPHRAFAPGRRTQLRASMRAQLGAGEDDIVVLMIANEWHRKGLGVLLEAVAAVGDQRLRVDLVGVRSPADYEPVARRLGLDGRMRWHGPSQDIARFHAAADVFALPTVYEPFGLVIVEAMASGLPVVASRLAGASEAITPGVNGLLLDDPHDVAELAAALARLLDPALRASVGEAAAASVDPYRWDSVFARVDSIVFAD